jgi:kynureninase
MTASDPTGPAATPVNLDIRRITLDGYSLGHREHFSASIQAQLAGHGAAAAAAWQAAEAILAAVDARLAGPGRSAPGRTTDA